MSDNVFGIDLGTSNSALAYLDALGTPKIKENGDGDATTPSVVWFESESNTVVGKLAREEKLFSPTSVIDLVKREMGRETDWEFHGRRYTPESISALILRSLVSLVDTPMVRVTETGIETTAGHEEFDLIVWATGFRPDYSWLHLPVLDRKGEIRHEGGVVPSAPGLYRIGTNFLRRRKSSFIFGLQDDAVDLVEHLVANLATSGV